MPHDVLAEPVTIGVAEGEIAADLRRPQRALGLVLFAHGSGSSRHSSRNRAVADYLDRRGFATLLLDLLTRDEEEVDLRTSAHRFDIERLGQRVVQATDWLATRDDLRRMPLGYFGASTGAAAALIGAAERPDRVQAVVSRGGRPDLAGEALARVQAPVRLIVGGDDEPVVEMNRDAMRRMRTLVEIDTIPGATHLFEEPGTLDQVMRLAGDWFARFLTGPDLQDGLAPGE